MKRWVMLALGTAAQAVACVFVYGLPYVSDTLRHDNGLSLTQIGLLIACPTVGLVVTLVAWGALADSRGERLVISVGLAATAIILGASAGVHGMVALGALFFLAGAASASVYAASGRLVMGWFSARERGLAMGIRHTSTPLGMGIAALAIPPLAARWGVAGSIVFSSVLCAVVALLIGVIATDPPRGPKAKGDERGGNPYRRPALWRIHGASALLCVPQFTVSAFALVFLVDVRGWTAVHAGQLLAAAQVLGAASRVVAGRWSDRTGNRVRLMRRLACAISLVMLLTALGAVWSSSLTDIVVIVACGITASTNGLAFTVTAELAGRSWSGRAMGVQNTGQNLAASLTPPLLGALISHAGYAWGFLLAGVLAAVAAGVVPPLPGPATGLLPAGVPGAQDQAERPREGTR